MIILNGSEFLTYSYEENFLYSRCEIGYIFLHKDDPRMIEIMDSKEKTFEVSVVNPRMPNLRQVPRVVEFSKCVRCGWRTLDSGNIDLQINYWNSRRLDIQEARDIIISSI